MNDTSPRLVVIDKDVRTKGGLVLETLRWYPTESGRQTAKRHFRALWLETTELNREEFPGYGLLATHPAKDDLLKTAAR